MAETRLSYVKVCAATVTTTLSLLEQEILPAVRSCRCHSFTTSLPLDASKSAAVDAGLREGAQRRPYRACAEAATPLRAIRAAVIVWEVC